MGHTSVPEEAYAKMLATKVQLGDAQGLYEMLIEEQQYGRNLLMHLSEMHQCAFPVSHANGLVDTGYEVFPEWMPYQVRDMSVQQILDSLTAQQMAELRERMDIATEELNKSNGRVFWIMLSALIASWAALVIAAFTW